MQPDNASASSVEAVFKPAFDEIARRQDVAKSRAWDETTYFAPSSTSINLPFVLAEQEFALISMGTTVLAPRPVDPTRPALRVYGAFATRDDIRSAMRTDLTAVFDRDSACESFHLPLLYFKGFHALQLHRVANWLWSQNRRSLALLMQSRASMKFGVDIHPAARFGVGIMLDHATGLVVGETAVVGNQVSILQSVTLGGTGKEHGDRHPKIGDGVLISAGAKILGNIAVGEGAKIGAGSVVLRDVPPHTTVAGVPAKVVGKPDSDLPALNMNHEIPDYEW